MEIKIIPCLKDNYAYIVELKCGSSSQKNILIDAPSFSEVDEFLEANGIHLDFIFTTHHHWDHTDGNLDLQKKYNCKIYGSEDDKSRIPGINHGLKHEEIFKIDDVEIQALYVPGHTSHHVIYYFKKDKVLFTGDTLFSMGCGRVFEGTFEEMFHSLQKIKALPDETKIYCGHEYSQNNAEFNLSIFPDNQDLQKRYKEVLELRHKNQPTVPTSLALEKKINGFLRASTVDEFAKLRQLKDTF